MQLHGTPADILELLQNWEPVEEMAVIICFEQAVVNAIEISITCFAVIKTGK